MSSASSIPKIDVHHHIIPAQIAGESSGLKGMTIPTWNLATDEAFSRKIGVRTRIFSVSVPGVLHIGNAEEAAKVARSMNETCAAIKAKDTASCGYFATLPSLIHIREALQELCYAFDHLSADGVTLFTSYGQLNGYLGHDDFIPIWQELNRRKAVVFVHPCDNGPGVQGFNPLVLGPGFDWPHETGRTAMDMIVKGRMQQFPDVKIILSHAGGTLPVLVRRATMISLPEFGGVMTANEIYEGAQRFYFDTALSGSGEVLPLITGFAKPGHLLFGSDYPHAFAEQSKAHTDFLDGYPLDPSDRKEIYHEAALKLFPRLKQVYQVE